MIQTHQQDPSVFVSRDIYISSVLCQAGIPLIRVEGNGRQGIFVFKASKEINNLVTQYFSGQLRIDPKGLFETWKGLKSMAFSTIGNVR